MKEELWDIKQHGAGGGIDEGAGEVVFNDDWPKMISNGFTGV